MQSGKGTKMLCVTSSTKILVSTNSSRLFLHTKQQSKIRLPKEKLQPCPIAIRDFAITSFAPHSSSPSMNMDNSRLSKPA